MGADLQLIFLDFFFFDKWKVNENRKSPSLHLFTLSNIEQKKTWFGKRKLVFDLLIPKVYKVLIKGRQKKRSQHFFDKKNQTLSCLGFCHEGPLIIKRLFGILEFVQKTNELSAWKKRYDFVWSLVDNAFLKVKDHSLATA